MGAALFATHEVIPRPYGLFYKDARASFPGVTLLTPLRGPSVYLLDWDGNTVMHWTVPDVPSLEELAQNPTLIRSGVARAKLLPNGHLLAGYGGKGLSLQSTERGSMLRLAELDRTSAIVWEYRSNFMHHDFARLPDGTTAVIVSEELSPEFADRVQGGITSSTNGVTHRPMVADAIIEIDARGQERWRWSAKDHLDPAAPENRLDIGVGRDFWTYMNAIQYVEHNPLTGTPAYLASFNMLDTLALIDRATGNIIWRWGTGVLAGQHGVSLISDGSVITFDNGAPRQHLAKSHGLTRGAFYTLFSRVIIVDMKTKVVSYIFTPGQLEQGRALFYTPIGGSVQALPNGNILVSAGYSGKVFELDPRRNEVVWDYTSPFGLPVTKWPGAVQNGVYSAYRYAQDYAAPLLR